MKTPACQKGTYSMDVSKYSTHFSESSNLKLIKKLNTYTYYFNPHRYIQSPHKKNQSKLVQPLTKGPLYVTKKTLPSHTEFH